MKRIMLLCALVCAFCLPAFAQTAVSGTKVLDNNGNLLASGQWCFGATCETVTNGAFSGSVTAGTQTVTVTNGSGTTYLTVPSVTVGSSVFVWDTYVVPTGIALSGMGVPRVAAQVGVTYTQTDANNLQWTSISQNGQVIWSSSGGGGGSASSGLYAGSGVPTFTCTSPCQYTRIDASPSSNALYALVAAAGTVSSNWVLQTGASSGLQEVNLKNYASGSAETTTTTASLTSGSTSVPVASCEDFTQSGAGALYGTEGVDIVGAGTGVSTTATTTSGSYTITVASATGITGSMLVIGSGIPTGDRVTGISGTTITLESAATATASGVAVTLASDYIGTVSACTGTTMTVTPATSFTVASGTTVQHDDSAALQNLITSGASTGEIIIAPSGTYNLNGPLQETSGADAIIKMPEIPYGQTPTNVPPTSFVIEGSTAPTGGTNNGTIFQSQQTYGNVFGAYCLSCTTYYPTFTNVWLNVQNATFREYPNPAIKFFNLERAVAATFDHIYCDTGYPGGFMGDQFLNPSSLNHPNGVCIDYPTVLNNVSNNMDDVWTQGYYTGVSVNEHTNIGALYALFDYNGLQPNGNTSSVGANGIHIGYYWCQECVNIINAGTTVSTLDIDVLDLEAGSAINDPNNLLYGTIKFNIPYQSAGSTAIPSITGGANLQFQNLNAPNTYISNSTVSAGGGAQYFQPNLPTGGYVPLLVGQHPVAYESGGITFQSNATADLSTVGLAVYGQNGIQVNGLNQATLPGPFQMQSLITTAAAPTVSAGQIAYGSTTVASSYCGSLSGAAGCIVVNIAGTTHYVPYY